MGNGKPGTREAHSIHRIEERAYAAVAMTDFVVRWIAAVDPTLPELFARLGITGD